MGKIIFVFLMFFTLSTTLTMIACKRMKRKYDNDEDVYGQYPPHGV